MTEENISVKIARLEELAFRNREDHLEINKTLVRIEDSMYRRLPLWVTVSLPPILSILSGTIVYLATH